MQKTPTSLIPIERIVHSIFIIRGQKVLLSVSLAALYGVEPKVLLQAVKRNRERFPYDFMFQLTKDEFQSLRSQIATSSRGGIRRAMPYAFTEQGVAMLSSVLRSQSAIQVNVEIMRAFVRLRLLLQSNKKMAERLAELEKKYDEQFRIIFEVIKVLTERPITPKGPMGFRSS